MSMNWIIAVDGSESSERAALYAESLALKCQASLIIAHIVDWSQFSFLTPEELAERHHNKEAEIERAQTRILKPLAEKLRTNGIAVHCIVRHGNPADEIQKLVETEHASMLFAGRKGASNSLVEMLFGGVASALIQTSPVPVTLVP